MAITQTNDEIKIQSGNNFKTYDTAWGTLGNIVSGKLLKKGDFVQGQWANGYKWKKRGGGEAGMTIVLGQVKKEIMDKIDQLIGVKTKVYFYNGRTNAKDMEFFAPDCEIIDAIELEMEGNKHQTLGLEIAFNPQNSNVTCTPDTDLPTDAYASGTNPLTGYNPFYIILETAAA